MGRPLQPCVYCGSTSDLTWDHIPPKNLFNKPRPQLITVRACRNCNSGFRLDDDYFWLTLASRKETENNDEATRASFRAIKNLARPEAAGFRASFIAAVQPVSVRTAAGLYVGDTLAYDVSFPRLNRIAARITRGLFAFERGVTLQSGYSATARALEGFTHTADGSLRQLVGFAAGVPRKEIGRTFGYRFRPLPDDPNSSVTLFDIYETSAFIGLTIRTSEISWPERV